MAAFGPQPFIFISAVADELREQRTIVADALRFLGFEPLFEEASNRPASQQRAAIEEKIVKCHALIQIVGHALGSEMKDAQHPGGSFSCTQYEASFATKKSLNVWYLVLDDEWKPPLTTAQGAPLPPEPVAGQEVQRVYRRLVRRSPQMRDRIRNNTDLELNVYRLLRDLDLLRPQDTRWIRPPGASPRQLEPAVPPQVAPSSGGGSAPNAPAPPVKPAPPAVSGAALERAVSTAFEDWYLKHRDLRRDRSERDDTASEDALIQKLATPIGIAPAALSEEFERIAMNRLERKGLGDFQHAQAAFALRDYASAERLAVKAGNAAKKANPRRRFDALQAFELAGQCALELRHGVDALRHFSSAITLTDDERDAVEWARFQHWLACVRDELGDFARAEALLRHVIPIRRKDLGADHPDTLSSRTLLAHTLYAQGKLADAEEEQRALVAIRTTIAGPEHPDTLSIRNWLGMTLHAEDRMEEAEVEHSAVLAIRERVHGAEHAATLRSRGNLANTLHAQRKYDDAEAAHRAVLAIRERTLGPDHPNTLNSFYSLSLAVLQRDPAEALRLAKRAFEGALKSLGVEHPDTTIYRLQFEHLSGSDNP